MVVGLFIVIVHFMFFFVWFGGVRGVFCAYCFRGFFYSIFLFFKLNFVYFTSFIFQDKKEIKYYSVVG